MDGIWLVSHLVLWMVVLLLAAVVLRQRSAPQRAKADMLAEPELEIGGLFPAVTVHTPEGYTEPLLPPDSRLRLIVFTLGDCPACEKVYDLLREFQEAYMQNRSFQLVLVMLTPSASTLRERLSKHGLRYRAVYITEKEGRQFPLKVAPYGVVLNDRNRVLGKAMLNDRRDWEALLRAANQMRPGAQAASPAPAPVSYIQ